MLVVVDAVSPEKKFALRHMTPSVKVKSTKSFVFGAGDSTPAPACLIAICLEFCAEPRSTCEPWEL